MSAEGASQLLTWLAEEHLGPGLNHGTGRAADGGVVVGEQQVLIVLAAATGTLVQVSCWLV